MAGHPFPAGRRTGANAWNAVLLALLFIGFSIAFVDRPLAGWSHENLRGIALFVWLTWIVEPVPGLAVVGLAGIGAAVLAGWRPGRIGWIVLACCLSSLLALALKDQLKLFCGRTWPETWTNGNPSWIANGVFAWQPFHGGEGWRSFPSGHTTLMAAPMSVLWRVLARMRWLSALPVVLVAAGLLGADYHWLSDIVAGGLLGTLTGFATVGLLKERLLRDGA